jgi:hypothetical protein
VDMGTSASDIAYATTMSSRRRELYRRGAYRPTCYIVIWPRQDLIAWSAKAARDPKWSFERFAADHGHGGPLLSGRFKPQAHFALKLY